MITQINKILLGRRSALAFEPKEIPATDVKLLFEAASLAPSSYNEQPWRFYHASRSNTNAFSKILDSLASANAEWAKNSSLLVVSVAKRNLSVNGKENGYALHDTGMATANLLAQAESMGLGTHIMGGFDREKVSKTLEIHEDFTVVAVIAIGYHGDIAKLSETNQRRASSPRVRKPYHEVVFEV